MLCIVIKIIKMLSSWCQDLVTLAEYLKSVVSSWCQDLVILAEYLKSIAYTRCVPVIVSQSRAATMIVIFKCIVAEMFKGLRSKID